MVLAFGPLPVSSRWAVFLLLPVSAASVVGLALIGALN